MTKVHSGLKSFSPPSTLSSLPRSHSRQRSTTPTLMRRARCACLWSVQRTGSLPPKLTKVGAEVLHRAARCESQRAGELHVFWFLSDVMIAGKKVRVQNKTLSCFSNCPSVGLRAFSHRAACDEQSRKRVLCTRMVVWSKTQCLVCFVFIEQHSYSNGKLTILWLSKASHRLDGCVFLYRCYYSC